tara:strand:- start:787 stop:951 length:165 start_codon:yes stop_codon:yes gene_type:complete
MKEINSWFWNHTYRYYLRDASTYKQNKILRAFISKKLEIDGESDIHLNIIKKII